MITVLRAVVTSTVMGIGTITLMDIVGRRVKHAYKYARAQHRRRKTLNSKKGN